jgi:hypothetical protein
MTAFYRAKSANKRFSLKTVDQRDFSALWANSSIVKPAEFSGRSEIRHPRVPFLPLLA